ncbi:MAG: type II toxin-antitoxin system VapB family antitoxin [Lysobacterales bacterium]
MALQIANPIVVKKVEKLAKATGLSKTALVERAVDYLALETQRAASPGPRLQALLTQIDRIPDRNDASDPLPWDESGLPT